MHASAAVDGRELGAGTSAQLSLVRMLVWSCCSLPTALLLTALWGGEDPSGERRNPIFFRQYGFLYLGFVLMIRIKARNVNMEECILWASLTLCFFLRRWVKEKNSKEQFKSLWATWYLERGSVDHHFSLPWNSKNQSLLGISGACGKESEEAARAVLRIRLGNKEQYWPANPSCLYGSGCCVHLQQELPWSA